MHSYPPAALALVERYAAAAAAAPERAIAFQVAPGANSHRALCDGRAGSAMIPIENSQHGRVADIHFLPPESGLAIVGEHFLAISHCLMALPQAGDGPFEAAYSHPQALGQSRRFLRERGIVP